MFDDVSGLKVYDAVQIAGVKVGKVTAITLSQKNGRARVAMQIDAGVIVDDQAIASIKTSGIIGDKYVSISIGGGEPLKDGRVITQTESSFVLEDAVRQLLGEAKSGGGDASENRSKSPCACAIRAAGGTRECSKSSLWQRIRQNLSRADLRGPRSAD